MKSTLAGTWYVADAGALRAEIAGYFEQVQAEARDDIIGLILPHAGYQYSGRTAAHAVKSLGRSYTRVVVIGPTHRLPMEDMLSVSRATHYQSPLGEVPLDVEFIRQLLKYPIFQDVPAAHEQEHSVQIEIPLLQYKLGDFKLVPIVAGQCSYETVAQAGRILAGLIDKDTLVVASSDFTHYGPQLSVRAVHEGHPGEPQEARHGCVRVHQQEGPSRPAGVQAKDGRDDLRLRADLDPARRRCPAGRRPSSSSTPPPAS